MRPPSRISRNCLKPGAARAEQVVLGHAAVLEGELARVRGAPAHLPHGRGDRVPRRAVGDDDVRDLVVARPRRDRDAGSQVGARIRDEDLGAVHDPLAALELGARPGGAGVRAGARLGEAEGRQPPARGQVGSHSRFCSSEPKRRNGIVPSEVCAATVIATDESMRVSSSIAIAYASVSPPGAPVLLGDRDAHEPQLGQLGDDLVGEAVLAVELLRHRRDPLLGERAHGLAQELVLGREVEVHRYAGEAAGELGEEPDAVAGRARAACSSRRGRARGRRCRRCRGAPTGPRPRTSPGRRRRGSARPAGGPRSSSGRRRPSRCSGGSARAAAGARHGRRSPRPPPRSRRTTRRRSPKSPA